MALKFATASFFRFRIYPFAVLAATTLFLCLPFFNQTSFSWAEMNSSLQALVFSYAAMVICHACLYIGGTNAMRLLFISSAISFAVEGIAIQWGWLFGFKYNYHPAVVPMLPGDVPLVIPLMWFGSAYSALVLLRSISILSGSVFSIRKLLQKAALCALYLAGMDLIYDPLGVSSRLWVWHEPGNYFGTPYHNFAGWFLTGFAIFACFLILEKPRSKGRPEDFLTLEIYFALVSLLLAVVCSAACWLYLQNFWPIVLTVVILGPFWIFFVASVRGVRCEWASGSGLDS